MSLNGRKFKTLLGVYYAEMMEYRAELYLWALAGIMPFILMGLWMEAGAKGNFNMTEVQFARYFLAVFVVRQFTMVWVVYEFEQDVIKGRLSLLLLQPLTPFWRYFASHSAERFARLPFVVILVALFFLIYPKAYWLPSLTDLVLATVFICLAFILRFIMQYAFGMLAFWTERANAIEDLWFIAYLFLSGFLAPLDVFPPLVRQVALMTPFPYLVYLPSMLLTGQPVNLAGGLLVMLLWGVFSVAVYQLLWHCGLRKYSGMGA